MTNQQIPMERSLAIRPDQTMLHPLLTPASSSKYQVNKRGPYVLPYNLEKLLGDTGLPQGKITEIYGPPKSGKSMLALQVLAGFQDQTGKFGVYIDAGRNFNQSQAYRMECDLDRLMIYQSNRISQISNLITSQILFSNEVGAIVVDSTGFLLGNNMNCQRSRDQELAQMLAKVIDSLNISDSKTVVLFLSGLEKNYSSYGERTRSTGGISLAHAADTQIELRRIDPKPGEFNFQAEATLRKSGQALGCGKVKLTASSWHGFFPLSVERTPHQNRVRTSDWGTLNP